MSNWISVSDDLPPIDQRVLVCGTTSVEIMRRDALPGYWDWDGDIEEWPVKYWQPLPEAKETEE